MFFSVKVPMCIGGKTYKTCICYPLPEQLKATVEGLEKQRKAVIYSEQRFFCNGKLVEPKKKVEVKKAPSKKVEEKKDETEGF